MRDLRRWLGVSRSDGVQGSRFTFHVSRLPLFGRFFALGGLGGLFFRLLLLSRLGGFGEFEGAGKQAREQCW